MKRFPSAYSLAFIVFVIGVGTIPTVCYAGEVLQNIGLISSLSAFPISENPDELPKPPYYSLRIRDEFATDCENVILSLSGNAGVSSCWIEQSPFEGIDCTDESCLFPFLWTDVDFLGAGTSGPGDSIRLHTELERLVALTNRSTFPLFISLFYGGDFNMFGYPMDSAEETVFGSAHLALTAIFDPLSQSGCGGVPGSPATVELVIGLNSGTAITVQNGGEVFLECTIAPGERVDLQYLVSSDVSLAFLPEPSTLALLLVSFVSMSLVSVVHRSR